MPFYGEVPRSAVDPTEPFPFVNEEEAREDREALMALCAEQNALLQAVAIVVATVDAVMPALERALASEWKRGNYINGPQFGSALERLREALGREESAA